jgi:hypothetical protein
MLTGPSTHDAQDLVWPAPQQDRISGDYAQIQPTHPHV